MRQLLLAGLGAAGLLLINLPALAQLSNDTSTFNGEVAATCLFDLQDTTSLTYNSSYNYFTGGHEFDLTTNSPNIRMSLSQISVGSEPVPASSEVVKRVSLFHKEGNLYTNVANTDTRQLSDPIAVSTSGMNTFKISMSVLTTVFANNRYGLGPGNYSYSVTLSCLL